MDGPASGQAQIERSLIFRVNTNLQFKSFVLWLYVCVCVAVMGLVQKKKHCPFARKARQAFVAP